MSPTPRARTVRIKVPVMPAGHRFIDATPTRTPGICVHPSLDGPDFTLTLTVSGDALMKKIKTRSLALDAAAYLAALGDWTDLALVMTDRIRRRDLLLKSPYRRNVLAASGNPERSHVPLNRLDAEIETT